MRDARRRRGRCARTSSALFGVEARVISGDEEARLTFRGRARAGCRSHADRGRGLRHRRREHRGRHRATRERAPALDVRGELRRRQRATHRAPRAHDPPTRAERDGDRERAATPSRRVPPLAAGTSPVGIAGTMTTLAAVSLGPRRRTTARACTGTRCPATELAGASCDDLARHRRSRRGVTSPAWSRSAPTSSSPAASSRSRSSTTGSARACVVSDRGVRWGLAEELAASTRWARRAFSHAKMLGETRSGRSLAPETWERMRQAPVRDLTNGSATALECACLFS